MGWLMDPIYTAIAWILLHWHMVWNAILPDGNLLGTTWDWVLAIVFLVITVRIILFPIFVKQIRSQRAMQALQPKIKELQQKHKGDQQTLREEMMKLYQAEKVNPLMGCLPLFLQIPVFLGLFRVLKYLNPFEPRKTQFGFTVDQFNSAAHARLLNAPIPARFADSATQLGALGSHGVTVKVVAGLLILIMMATTFLTSRQMILKTGWSQDPQQRMIQKLMLYGIPFSLLLSGWYFPIGVIIYWVTQNLFSLGQQYWVLHKYPPPVTAGNIPMKSIRSGASGDGASSSFLSRLLKAEPKPPATQATGRTGFLNAEQPQRAGLFRRRTAAPPPDAPKPQSLAPRPGAKPVRQTPAADSTPTGAAPAPPASPPAESPNGSGDGPGGGTGTRAGGGAAPTTSANGGGAARSASSTGGRGKSTAKKVTANPRKGQGQVKRKGSAKR